MMSRSSAEDSQSGASLPVNDLYRLLLDRASGPGGDEWLRLCLELLVPAHREEGELLPSAPSSSATRSTMSGRQKGAEEVEASEFGASASMVFDVSSAGQVSGDVIESLPEAEEQAEQPRRSLRSANRPKRKNYSPEAARHSRTASKKTPVPPSRSVSSIAPTGREEEIQAPAERASIDKATKMVWILGHSFVHWARRRAVSRSYGLNLGFPDKEVCIFWGGKRGLVLSELFDLCLSKAAIWPNPDILILHIGGNDIGKWNTSMLYQNLKQTVFAVKEVCPAALIVFSEIIPRLVWLDKNERFKDRIRKRLNRSMEKFMLKINGFSYRHVDLEAFVRGLYWSDKVHLSMIGMDIFNVGLQNMIEKATVVGGHD
ncbi:uncharacterized protein LOC130277420 [Hyla sarda]|uniref:uncharacterized protein LOC130277420 n=1 Tax=Hyla sarda TaxID=327740 RepID=UPI0024C38161|nr:uncharacterized protein LOC130277420 [Hyla sarda]